MTDKYSLAKCEQYGRRLAARLCDQHFGVAPDILLDGPALLGFTPIRQLNLFVVRQLLQQWQQETNRLRSPYFDFSAPAVQAALVQFQNTLSRHLSLARPVFEPLLAHATTTAIQLAADPTSTFERLLPATPELTVPQLSEGLRYFDINKEFFTSFINSLPPDSVLSSDQLVARLRAYQEANYRVHQPIQQLVVALSNLLPLTEADLWQDGPVSTTSASVSAASPSAPTPTIEAAVVTPTHFISDYKSHQPTITLPSEKLLIGTLTAEAASTPATDNAPLYEKLRAAQPPTIPLASALRTIQPTTAPTERGASKVESLREAISINQRFSFINELFNGENTEYHAAIQHLDSLTTHDQARLYITQNLATRYNWSRKEEHMAKLLKLVDRKFVPIA